MKTKPTELARANYDRGVLTLDLPRAMQPMLWRQEIKNISNVAFWIAPQDGGQSALMLRLANGTEQTIARFNDEAIAEQSLAAIRAIFINKRPKAGFWGSLLQIILIILVVWVLGSFAFQLAAAIAQKQTINATQTTTAPQPSSPTTNGEPTGH